MTMENKNNELMETNEQDFKVSEMYDGLSAFRNAWSIANKLAKSDMIPTEFRNKPENCVIALDLSSRLGMSPFMIMQNMYIVYGKPGFSAKFCIAVVNKSGRFQGPLRFKVEGKGDKMSCYAYATYKGEEEPVKGTTITIEMAKAEGWVDRNGSKWR